MEIVFFLIFWVKKFEIKPLIIFDKKMYCIENNKVHMKKKPSVSIKKEIVLKNRRDECVREKVFFGCAKNG